MKERTSQGGGEHKTVVTKEDIRKGLIDLGMKSGAIVGGATARSAASAMLKAGRTQSLML